MLATLLLASGCGAGVGSPPPPRDCPPATAPGDSLRYGSVVLDERVIATRAPFRLEQLAPESYSLVGREPDELAALPVERIALVQFASGADVEARYLLCPGTVAMLVTTHRR